MLHGQRLSFDLAHPNPQPIIRSSSAPKTNPLHPPPSSARPSSAMGARPPLQEPIKGAGGPSPYKRPTSATPGGGANRFVYENIL